MHIPLLPPSAGRRSPFTGGAVALPRPAGATGFAATGFAASVAAVLDPFARLARRAHARASGALTVLARSVRATRLRG
jgi:hypothetical protein